MASRSLALTVYCLLITCCALVQAENWPDFRGPHGDGHSDATRLARSWSESSNVRWKTPVPGRGWSTPVVWNGKIWLTTATDEGQKLWALCIDQESGKLERETLIFQIEEPEKVNSLNSFASPSPVIDGERVYVHFGTYGTAAIDTTSGQVVWTRTDLKLNHMEGPGSSPILHGDRLLLTCDGTDVQFTIALDAKTGDTVWQTNRSVDLAALQSDIRKAFATPLIATIGGQKQLISPGAQAVYGYDPATGKELWKFRYSGFSNIARPLIDREHIYINTGYMKPQTVAIKLGGSGDITETHLAWTNTQANPNKPSPLLIDGLLYLVSDNGGVATCLDAKTGEKVWSKRLGGSFSASPLYADGHIYLCDQDDKTFVLKPGREFQEVAVNELGDGFMASPIAVGHAIYLRSKTHLYRIEAQPAAAE
jgi:outer membrane protein assembly factor BamB